MQERTLDAVFREAAASSRRWFYNKTGDADLAEELTAAAFLRLCIYYADKPGVDVDANLLHIINYGLLHNHLRTQRSRGRKKPLEELEPSTYVELDQLERSLFTQELNAHLASLPVRERTELTLWLLRGLTVREIAAIVGGDYTRVSRRISRALKRLEKEVLSEPIAV